MSAIHFSLEQDPCNTNETYNDIFSLSWIPLETFRESDREDGGMLAIGGESRIVGITHTANPLRYNDLPSRYNYNLPDSIHDGVITTVAWSEFTGHLASGDSQGVVRVWTLLGKYCGQLSSPVTNGPAVVDLTWSEAQLLVCYSNGKLHVIIPGSNQFLNFPVGENVSYHMSCFSFTPDSRHFYVGTSESLLLVFSTEDLAEPKRVSAAIASIPITSVAWNHNCYKENTEENHVLSVALLDGTILFMKELDDPGSEKLTTGLINITMKWSRHGLLLAVMGYSVATGTSALQIWSTEGHCLLKVCPPALQKAPINSLAWGHQDRRLFLAVGRRVLVARLSCDTGPPPLEHLCAHVVYNSARIQDLDAHPAIREQLKDLQAPTIMRPLFPLTHMQQPCFLLRVPLKFMYCGVTSNDGGYLLSLDHMGGRLPLAQARYKGGLRTTFCISSYGCSKTIARIDSNIWGTHYVLRSMKSATPTTLGVIQFQPMLLQLQPREISVHMLRMDNDDCPMFSEHRYIPQLREFSLTVNMNSGTNPSIHGTLFIDMTTPTPTVAFYYPQVTVPWCKTVYKINIEHHKKDCTRKYDSPFATSSMLLKDKLCNEDYCMTTQMKPCNRRKKHTEDLLNMEHYKVPAELLLKYKLNSINETELASNVYNMTHTKPLWNVHPLNNPRMGHDLVAVGHASDFAAIHSLLIRDGPKVFHIHNISPTWNANQNVHQLNCGDRITMDSSKNCRFEIDGRCALLFGRNHLNSYTLDFAHPFTPIQAFAVALTSLTNRMK